MRTRAAAAVTLAVLTLAGCGNTIRHSTPPATVAPAPAPSPVPFTGPLPTYP